MFFRSKLLNSCRKLVTSTTRRNYQVTVVGAANELGQTLCLMLRVMPSITKLVVHDVQPYTPSVALDLFHIPVSSKLQGYSKKESLEEALQSADLVLATGSSVHKPGISSTDWLISNLEFIKTLGSKLAKMKPIPMVGIVTEPVNSMVPMLAEIMKFHGEYDPCKLFGITTMDSILATMLYANHRNIDIAKCYVPVIGGHTDDTIVPLFSQAIPSNKMKEREIVKMTERIRRQNKILFQKKQGWSPTMTTAYGAFIFTQAVLNSLDGIPTKIHAYVENNDFGTSFFSGLVDVDGNGAGEMTRYTGLTQYECRVLEESIKNLRQDVTEGKRVLELSE